MQKHAIARQDLKSRGAGFFVMEAKGHGRLLLSSYGALMRYDVQPGETRTIGECPRCSLKLPFTVFSTLPHPRSRFLLDTHFRCPH